MDHDTELIADGFRLLPLTRPTPQALTFLVAVADDPTSKQWSRSLRSIHDEASAVAWIQGRCGDDVSLEWLVVDDQGQGVGRVGLHRHGLDADLEVGYWTLARSRGRGVARAGARAVARYAHEVLHEPRVALVHASANPASCHVALASSFRQEGVLRGALDHGDGVKWDMHVHGRLADDTWDPLPPPVSPGPPVDLIGDGVLLRPWRPVDAPLLLETAADPLVVQWNPFGIHSLEDARRWIDNASAWSGHASWAVTDPATGEVLGSAALHHLDDTNARAEAGYWVVPAARGRGVGPRALAAATRFAFEVMTVQRVELYHALGNTGSCRVAEKAGFDLEGTIRRSYRYGDGLLHDEHVHARIAAG